MANPFTVLNVSGPYREPREAAFSYDYSIQRATWPTPHAVRVKISIPDELDYCKSTVLELTGGSPGQQMLINQLLMRRIADQKLQIANEENIFNDRLDVMVGPFIGALAHLFSRLDAWMRDSKPVLRREIHDKVKL